MGLIYQVTDTAGACSPAAYCQSLSAPASAANVVASVGGAAGTGTTQATNAGSANSPQVYYEMTVQTGDQIDNGTWTCTIDVTVANSNLTWSSFSVCQLNSSCVNQTSVASSSSVNIGLGTTGVKSASSSSSTALTPSSGDKFVFIATINNGTMNNQSFTWKHDGTVDAPIGVHVLQDMDTQFLNW